VTSNEAVYSPTEAALRSGCSTDTIRRKLKDGKLVGAFRDGPPPNGEWRIPLSALVIAGLVDLEAEPEREAPRSVEGDNDVRLRLAAAEAELRGMRLHNEALERHLERVTQLSLELATGRSLREAS